MENERKLLPKKPSRKEAMQRHHDFYTRTALTQPIDPADIPQMQTAVDRRLDGQVEPLEASNVPLVMDD